MNQPKVAVVYEGASSALQGLAKEVVSGAEEEGALVRVRRVRDHAVPRDGDGDSEGLATPDDVRWADAVIVGSPTRYGNVTPQLKSYLEALEVRGGEDLRETVWSGFAPHDGVLHGGREATLKALFQLLFRLGGVLVPAPRVDGLTELTVGHEMGVLARQTGRDVARVARRLLLGTDADRRQEVPPAVTDRAVVLS
jgi:NAD(P)H dehydrogenase (quinone)